MKERLQKILASSGIASRRRAEELILMGAVTVNGERAQLGMLADTDLDIVAVNGKPVRPLESHVYVALNKPAGYVSSLRSTHGEPTVRDLVPLAQRIFPVGRLDKDTSGLLLFTTDGEWANLVTHPRYEIEKEYEALVSGQVSGASVLRLRGGVTLPDGSRTGPAVVRIVQQERARTRLSVTVMEGKKRQIRLMVAAVGHPIIELRRVRIGPIVLGKLAEGRWWRLPNEEVEAIRAHGVHFTTRGNPPPKAAGRD
jgi:23S rRNA pseudouridine2605 synthase